MAVIRLKKRQVRFVRQDVQVQLSVTIKIILLAVSVYICSFALSVTFVGLFGINPFKVWNGFTIVTWLSGVRVLLVATSVILAKRYFLDQPMTYFKRVMARAGEGNFLMRADIESDDEFGLLGQHFNQMLSKVTELHANQLETEFDLVAANEELKYKQVLEKKNRIIQDTNKNLQALVKDLALLYEIGQDVNSVVELEELYRVITELFESRLRLREFAILIIDESRQFMNVKSSFGFANSDLIHDMTFRMGEGISGEVAQEGRMIYVRDTQRDHRFLHYRGELKEQGSFLSIPLIYKKDVLGVINFGRAGVDSFTKDEVRLFVLIANQIALAIENAKLYTMTRELSIRDELTGIYNRRHFQHSLKMEWKRAIRFRRPLSLLMVDVDYFKNYNDTFGHLQGDIVLKRLAALMQRNLREVDMVARFGGEEFVVLLPDTDRSGAMAVGEKLRHLVEREQYVDESTQVVTPVTISIGISAYPDDVREMDDLIDHADVALYKAKDSGRNRVVCHPQTNIPSDKTTLTDLAKPYLVS